MSKITFLVPKNQQNFAILFISLQYIVRKFAIAIAVVKKYLACWLPLAERSENKIHCIGHYNASGNLQQYSSFEHLLYKIHLYFTNKFDLTDRYSVKMKSSVATCKKYRNKRLKLVLMENRKKNYLPALVQKQVWIFLGDCHERWPMLIHPMMILHYIHLLVSLRIVIIRWDNSTCA